MKKEYEILKKYIDFSYHEKYSEEREILHEMILDEVFKNINPIPINQEKKLIFTAGCYGAGKSNLMKYLNNLNKINLSDYVYSDQDKLRIFIPEYQEYLLTNPLTAGFKTNKETGYLSELIQLYALENGYNLIIDGSLRDYEWYTLFINNIKSKYPNYKIIIMYVEASYANVLIRNNKRSKITKRIIPPECIRNAYIQSAISYDILRLLVHFSYKINTDSDEIRDLSIRNIDINL